MHTIYVAEVCKTSTLHALVAPQGMPLAKAIQHFMQDCNLRGIFLVDDAGRLTGVLNKHDLLDWVRVAFPLPPQGPYPLKAQLRRAVMAETAGDLARAESVETAVTLQDSLAVALQKMVRYNLVDIPVLDENGRIVNDLRLSEILAYLLRPEAPESPTYT